MLVPYRHKAVDEGYRYGFNGKEKDDELKGEGNSYDFGARMYDPRISRWFKTDYINKSWLSPYQFASNSPMVNIDPDGNDEIHFYYTINPAWNSEGEIVYQLQLSYDIVKNDAEHTFFMHNTQYNKTTQFYPFKNDNTPNQSSYKASKADLPMTEGVAWLFWTAALDDYAYLGRILQAAPQVTEHYNSLGDKKTAFKFNHAVSMAEEVDFSQNLITGTETVYAIVDGYYLLRGASKFIGKQIAKNSIKIGTRNLETIATKGKKPYSTGRPKYGKNQVEEVWQAAKQEDGKVYDPNTGEELIWDKTVKPRTWDMGHKPGQEFKKLYDDYMTGKISREEFLKRYRDPKNYHPESQSANRSRKFEQKND